MYTLNNFCNIISDLRKKQGLSQAKLSEKLEISPQSISKWENGVGFPDVTMFPKLAELFSIPIGVLFGENYEKKNMGKGFFFSKEDNKKIKLYIGNLCRVEFIEQETDDFIINAVGDRLFMEFFDVEKDEETVIINIKNPNSNSVHFEAYGKEGYAGENIVTVHTGRSKDMIEIQAINYLDLHVCSKDNQKGNFEVRSYNKL